MWSLLEMMVSHFNICCMFNCKTHQQLFSVFFKHIIKVVPLCCRADPQPDTEGGGIPVTPEEMSELMYKPLTGEWGERSRDEECDRIIAGIEQLITVGASAETGPSASSQQCVIVPATPTHTVCVCVLQRLLLRSPVLWT